MAEHETPLIDLGELPLLRGTVDASGSSARSSALTIVCEPREQALTPTQTAFLETTYKLASGDAVPVAQTPDWLTDVRLNEFGGRQVPAKPRRVVSLYMAAVMRFLGAHCPVRVCALPRSGPDGHVKDVAVIRHDCRDYVMVLQRTIGFGTPSAAWLEWYDVETAALTRQRLLSNERGWNSLAVAGDRFFLLSSDLNCCNVRIDMHAFGGAYLATFVPATEGPGWKWSQFYFNVAADHIAWFCVEGDGYPRDDGAPPVTHAKFEMFRISDGAYHTFNVPHPPNDKRQFYSCAVALTESASHVAVLSDSDLAHLRIYDVFSGGIVLAVPFRTGVFDRWSRLREIKMQFCVATGDIIIVESFSRFQRTSTAERGYVARYSPATGALARSSWVMGDTASAAHAVPFRGGALVLPGLRLYDF